MYSLISKPQIEVLTWFKKLKKIIALNLQRILIKKFFSYGLHNQKSSQRGYAPGL